MSPVLDIAMPADSQVAASARATLADSALISLAGGAEPALHSSSTQRSSKVCVASQVSMQYIDIDDEDDHDGDYAPPAETGDDDDEELFCIEISSKKVDSSA